MIEKSFVNLQRAQRVDQPDLQHIALTTPRDLVAQLVEELVVGADGPNAILWGFDLVSGPGSTVEYTRGSAVCGFRVNGELRRGMVVAGGPASRTFSVASSPDGTYGAYARLAFRETQVRTRRHWNAAGAPPGEVSTLQPTRISEDWDLTLERGNPGPEYLKLGNFTVAGGSATASLVGTRSNKLFDSNKGNRNYDNDDWGSADDRDETAVEANNPAAIKGLIRWVMMVGRQLQDIIDTDFFGFDPKSGTLAGVGPRSLTQLNNGKLDRAGNQTFAGLFGPDADQTRDQGALATRWRDIFARTLNFAGDLVSAATGVTFLSLSGGAAAGNQSLVRSTPNAGPGATTAELLVRAGTTGIGRIVLQAAEIVLDAATRIDVDNRRFRFINVGTGAGEANPGRTEAFVNEISAKSITKVLATVISDGAGAISIDEENSLNVASVTLQATNTVMRITFATPFATTGYQPLGSYMDTGGSNPQRFMEVLTKTVNYVDVRWYTSGGTLITITDDNVAGASYHVVVTGRQ